MDPATLFWQLQGRNYFHHISLQQPHLSVTVKCPWEEVDVSTFAVSQREGTRRAQRGPQHTAPAAALQTRCTCVFLPKREGEEM